VTALNEGALSPMRGMAKDGTDTSVSIELLLDLDLSSCTDTVQLLIMIIFIIFFPYFGQGLFLKRFPIWAWLEGRIQKGMTGSVCILRDWR
jgi:hypothetical protein